MIQITARKDSGGILSVLYFLVVRKTKHLMAGFTIPALCSSGRMGLWVPHAAHLYVAPPQMAHPYLNSLALMTGFCSGVIYIFINSKTKITNRMYRKLRFHILQLMKI